MNKSIEKISNLTGLDYGIVLPIIMDFVQSVHSGAISKADAQYDALVEISFMMGHQYYKELPCTMDQLDEALSCVSEEQR